MICALNPNSRVLVVSGDSLLLDLLCETIEIGGAHSIRASSIEEALHAFRNQRIDALVADSRLMDGSGTELVRRIRSSGGRIPGALMMGRDPDAEDLALLAGHAEVVFRKPFGIDDFLAGLKEMLDPRLPGLRLQGPPQGKGMQAARSVGESRRF